VWTVFQPAPKSHQLTCAPSGVRYHRDRATGFLHITMTMLHEVEVTLKLHPDVRSLNENWFGIGDQRARRKLQNRLNQRALRQ
jgi:hypothetical protein